INLLGGWGRRFDQASLIRLERPRRRTQRAWLVSLRLEHLKEPVEAAPVFRLPRCLVCSVRAFLQLARVIFLPPVPCQPRRRDYQSAKLPIEYGPAFLRVLQQDRCYQKALASMRDSRASRGDEARARDLRLHAAGLLVTPARVRLLSSLRIVAV